jgi:hypothetical protein
LCSALVGLDLAALFLEIRRLGVACECTDTYSPAAIDIAPATRPASAGDQHVRIGSHPPPRRRAAGSPSSTMPSFAPSTAARSHPTRIVRAVPNEGRHVTLRGRGAESVRLPCALNPAMPRAFSMRRSGISQRNATST